MVFQFVCGTRIFRVLALCSRCARSLHIAIAYDRVDFAPCVCISQWEVSLISVHRMRGLIGRVTSLFFWESGEGPSFCFLGVLNSTGVAWFQNYVDAVLVTSVPKRKSLLFDDWKLLMLDLFIDCRQNEEVYAR